MNVGWITGWFVSILVAIYLLIDAPKHGKNKWLWSILGLLFGLFAFWDIPHQNRKKRIGLDSTDRVHHHLFYCYTSLCLLLPVADLRILKRIIESAYT